MRLTIVRHADAGEKRHWHGPDLERPLDATGHEQVLALTPLLLRHDVGRIVSSPALRCVQTVEPLADAVGVTIETWADLGPDGFASRIITACFGDGEFDDAVLCTHGELLQPLLQLEDIRRQMSRHRFTRGRLLTKGSAWRLHLTSTGQVTKLVHLLPPGTRR